MRNQRGATILESFLVFLFLSLVFLGMFQVYMLAITNMVTNYAAYYAAKSWALGYNITTTWRAARVAAMSVSGKDISSRPLGEDDNLQRGAEERAKDYMMYDRYGAFGVNYQYWLDQRLEVPGMTTDNKVAPTYLHIGFLSGTEKVMGTVEVRNLQLNRLLEKFEFNVSNTVDMINYSTNYLVGDGYHVVVKDDD